MKPIWVGSIVAASAIAIATPLVVARSHHASSGEDREERDHHHPADERRRQPGTHRASPAERALIDRIARGESDKLLARRARRHGLVALDYQAGPLLAGVETRFSGKRFDDTANTRELAGYALVNLYASYTINRDWSAYARWNNVLDKDYRLANGYATPGSNVFVGVRYGFR